MSDSINADVTVIDTPATDTGAAIPTSTDPATTTAEMIEEMFDLTVDGQVEKVSKSELLKRASHSSAAAKRLQEATVEKKAALRLAELLKSDPIRAAKELNKEFDERDFLTKRLAALMEDDMMSPTERQTRADLEELRLYREEQKQLKELSEREELDKIVQARQGELDIEISSAIKDVGLPKTAASVKRLATYMLDAEEAGLKVSTKALAEQVKADMKVELLELLNVADDDAFEQLLGSDLITKAQRASLKKLKQPGQKVDPSIKKAVAQPDEKPKRKSREGAFADLGLGDVLF